MPTKSREPPYAEPASFDLTPMIDVTFQLIVFFLVANDLARKEISECALPRALNSVPDQPTPPVRVIVNVLRPPDPDDPAAPPEVWVRGRRYDLATLARFMQTLADQVREGGPGTASGVYSLIRANRETPWRHVQHVLQVCARPEVRIWKVQFATTRDPEPGRQP